MTHLFSLQGECTKQLKDEPNIPNIGKLYEEVAKVAKTSIGVLFPDYDAQVSGAGTINPAASNSCSLGNNHNDHVNCFLDCIYATHFAPGTGNKKAGKFAGAKCFGCNELIPYSALS